MSIPPGSGYRPDWRAPPGVRCWITQRGGGTSIGPWSHVDGSGGFNLGLHCGDDPAAVAANRAVLRHQLPQAPRWLSLVHGAAMVAGEDVPAGGAAPAAVFADGATALTPGVVCCITMADCLPVLLADSRGRGVAIAHAGWKGLAAGIIEQAVRQLRLRLGDSTATLSAWLGPAIGPRHFEVGADVLAAVQQHDAGAQAAFAPLDGARKGKYLANLFELATRALRREGVEDVQGGGRCTYSSPRDFYSYRRDGVTGRHAALVWLELT